MLLVNVCLLNGILVSKQFLKEIWKKSTLVHLYRQLVFQVLPVYSCQRIKAAVLYWKKANFLEFETHLSMLPCI